MNNDDCNDSFDSFDYDDYDTAQTICLDQVRDMYDYAPNGQLIGVMFAHDGRYRYID
jgi:hypothetical protein